MHLKHSMNHIVEYPQLIFSQILGHDWTIPVGVCIHGNDGDAGDGSSGGDEDGDEFEAPAAWLSLETA